jgi:DNA-binding HxlR family transcriptional regulator
LKRLTDPRGDGGGLAKALDVIGTRSALLILREALCGVTRFAEFAQNAGLSEPVTAARLRELVSHGLQ